MKNYKLKNLRLAQRISQKDLAEILGISQQTIASWEIGRTEPSNDNLKMIANYFNVTTDYLLGNEKESTPPITNEEKTLLADFKSLTVEGKHTLLNVLSSLKMTHVTESQY